MAKTSHAQLTEEAAEWLVKLDGGTANIEAFETWRAGDPHRAAAFAEVAHAWREMDRLRPSRSQIPPPPRALMTRRGLLRSVAAAGVIGLTGAIGFPFANEASATTGPGERRMLRLPDGSRIDLNTRTQVRWPRLIGERTLWLDQGEIAIEVARDGAPFRLVAAETVALDRGTFNIRRDAEVLTILPISGRAIAAGRAIDVGRIASVTKERTAISSADSATIARATDWRQGDLVFDGETLGSAITEYNRYLDRPITVTDPDLAQERVGGRFRTDDPRPFLQALADGFGAKVVDSGSGPILLAATQKKLGTQ